MEKDYREVIRSVFASRDDQDFIERWVGRATEAPDFLARCRDYRDGVRTKSDKELQEILDTVDIAFMERNPRFQGLGIRLSPEQWGKSRNAFLREEAHERLSACLAAVREAICREELNETGFFEQVEVWLQRQQSSPDFCKVANVLETRREAFIKGVMRLSEALHSESLDRYLSVLLDNLFSHHERVVSFAVILAADAGDESNHKTTDSVQKQLKYFLNGWSIGNATTRSHARGALAVLGIIKDEAGRHRQQVTFLPGGKEFLEKLLEKFEATAMESENLPKVG